MYIDCRNCALFDSDECQEYRTEYHSSRTCDNYQAQRYFILAGVEHVSKDGRYRLNSDYERLEQENAKLKRDKKDQCIMYDDLHKKYTKVLERMTKAEAKLHNIEEGLRKLESFLMDGMDRSIEPVNVDGEPMFALCVGRRETKPMAPTLADLIDKILTGGE